VPIRPETSLTAPAQSQDTTASKILDAAEQLAQTRGFNGFSYADIAAKLLITKASLHYHFRSKAELGRALIARYHATFGNALEGIAAGAGDARTKLQRYVGLYEQVMVNDRMCLCGMLAAEYATLAAPLQDGLRQFFDANERWLSAQLEEGRQAGTLVFGGPAHERAQLLLGALEGAMLVARIYGDAQRFRTTAQQVVADLNAPSRPAGSAARGARRR
jgi:TetR/AcrR family transcriptional repressor of nem operon